MAHGALGGKLIGAGGGGFLMFYADNKRRLRQAMREQGQGDMGLGRKMRQFADAWYGRLGAYSTAKDVYVLAAALARNLYRGGVLDDRVISLAEYTLAAREYMRYAPAQALDFGPLPALGLP